MTTLTKALDSGETLATRVATFQHKKALIWGIATFLLLVPGWSILKRGEAALVVSEAAAEAARAEVLLQTGAGLMGLWAAVTVAVLVAFGLQDLGKGIGLGIAATRTPPTSG